MRISAAELGPRNSGGGPAGILTRRTLLKLGGAAAASASALPARAQSRESRPNILFLMADQHRADCIGAAGNAAIRTPNLDRIAREGVLFTSAYSSTPTCTPARTALLTGLSPWHHGMLGYSDIAQRYPFEKPRALRDAGYYAVAVGKQHYSPMRNGHGYQRLILDAHCPCGNGPAALAAAEAKGPVERTDYESWFYSQAPNLDPHATGLWWNDYPAKPYALPENLHPTKWTGDTAVNFLEYLAREPAVFPEGLLHSPAQSLRSARPIHGPVRRCGAARSASRQMGGPIRAA